MQVVHVDSVKIEQKEEEHVKSLAEVLFADEQNDAQIEIKKLDETDEKEEQNQDEEQSSQTKVSGLKKAYSHGT